MQTRLRISCPIYGLPEATIPATWDSVMTWKPDEEFKNYIFEPKNDIIIQCSDLAPNWDVDEIGRPWTTILILDNSCYTFEIAIDIFCEGVWTELWYGTFTSTEWAINRDKKILTIKPKKEDEQIKCIKNNWTEVVNIYEIPEVVEVVPYTNVYGMFEYTDTYTGFDNCAFVPVPDGGDYCFLQVIESENTNGTPGSIFCAHIFHRLEREGTCDGVDPVPPDEFSTWTLFDGGCPGTPNFWTCPINQHLPVKFRNGRLFRDVIEDIVSQLGCGLTVESDFFNINPPGLAPDNLAYQFSTLYLQELVQFQKSDIKRFDGTNPSDKPSWVIKFQEVVRDLKVMFKVFPQVDGNILRLEHISFYEEQAGNDYTNEYYQNILQRDNSKAKRLTRFYYKDEQCSDYFRGVPIEIYCGEDEGEERCSVYYTDLSFAINTDNAESVTDAGWFLMCTEIVADKYRVIQDNRPLSFTQLHQNLHVYDMAGVGTINGDEVTPESLSKTRKQPSFKVRRKCCDDFDPAKFQTTSLGEGSVESADWTIEKNVLELNLKY